MRVCGLAGAGRARCLRLLFGPPKKTKKGRSVITVGGGAFGVGRRPQAINKSVSYLLFNAAGAALRDRWWQFDLGWGITGIRRFREFKLS